MAAPLLSICIPSYNREGFAHDALVALDAPGFLPFDYEVIVVDNASSASDYASVRSFVPRHFALRYVRLPRTVSVFANVMGSLRRAAGTFCLYLADDDRLDPEALAAVVGVMRADPRLVATYAMWDYFDLTENRVVGSGSALDDMIATADTATPALAMLVERHVLPEIGVYRTDRLAEVFLPSPGLFWAYLLILRQLRVGAVRLAQRPFYRYVVRRADDQYPRQTFASTMSLEAWEGVSRTLDIWTRHLPPEWAAEKHATSPLDAAKLSYLEFALWSAINRHALLEAFDLALTLGAYRDYRLPMAADAIQNVCLRALFEAVLQIYQGVPELAGIGVVGPEAFFIGLQTAPGGTEVAIVAAEEIPPARRPDYLILTMYDIQRADFIAQGCRPGLVLGYQSLLRMFGPDNLPPPRM